jgi:hypothetical protein
MAQKTNQHPEDPTDWLMNRQRAHTDELRESCSTGYIFLHNEGAAGQCEFHHIIPIEIMQDSSLPPEKVDFARKCMALTDWNINNSENLIGLPTKLPYEAADRHLNKGLEMLAAVLDVPHNIFGAIPDLPCHQREHDKYNRKLNTDFRSKIWNKLIKKRRACKMDGEKLKGQLETASGEWREFLVKRGAGPPSASTCWPNRNQKSFRKIWYKPFSMAIKPAKAEPPPDLFKTKGTQAEWLANLFGSIR